MSLIHNALKALEEPAAGAPAGRESSGFAVNAGTPDSSMSLRPVLIGILLLLPVGIAAIWWMNRQEMLTHAASQTQPSALPAPATEPDNTPVTTKISNNSIASVAPQPKEAPIQVTAVSAAADDVHALEKIAPATKPAANRKSGKLAVTPHKTMAHARPPLPAEVNVPAPPSAEVVFHEFLDALNRGDAAAGRVQLDKLAVVLPANSLALVRAQAWFAARTGDEPSAYKYYQAILERNAGDEEASLNLAALESKNGHADYAAAILSDALRNNRDSAALQQGLQKLRGGK